MRNYNSLTQNEQTTVENRFELPNNTNNLFVDKHGRVFNRVDGLLVMCTLKKRVIHDTFHNSQIRNNH